MSAHQVRVFSLLLTIKRDTVVAFERFCDLHDRGIGFEGLERASYYIRSGANPEQMDLQCTWTFSSAAPNEREKISLLVERWKSEFGVTPLYADDSTASLEEWELLHAYFGGGRQDHRSPLMDDVVGKAFVREPEGFAEIRHTNIQNGLPPIALSPQDGHMLMNLLRTAGAQRGVEIGTLGGYSAAWICEAIGAKGALVSVEKDAKRSRVAAQNLEKLGYGDRVECRVGDARQVIQNLSAQSPWDFVFIDADKSSYGAYFEWAMQNLKPGGLLIADNAYLWGGMLRFPKPWVDERPLNGALSRLHGFDAAEYQGMSTAWKLLSESQDFDTWMVPSPEGLLVSRKRRS